MANNRRIVRNSLLKSSLSIKSIQNSVTKFTSGILKARSSAGEIAKITSDSNRFKQSLIGKDNEFFRKRREGVARKVREDELEATTVGGVLRRQGTLVAKSTRGFLGRVMDFIGVLLLGWLINTLPGIIKMVGELIKKMRQVVNIMTGFVDGLADVLSGIFQTISGFVDRFKREDFEKSRNEMDENMTKAENGFNKLNQDLVTAVTPLQDYRNYGLTDDDVADVEDEAEKLRNEQKGNQQDQEQEGEQQQQQEGEQQQQGEQQQEGDKEEDNQEDKEEDKPSGFMRGLTGLVDFATFGKTDLDKRGDLIKSNESQTEEQGEQGEDSDASLNKKIDGFQVEGLTPNVSKVEQVKNVDELRQSLETEDAKTNENLDKPNKEEEKFSTGGEVEGKPGIDNVLAKLTSGEFIMTKETTERIGANFLEMLNKGGDIEQMIKPNTDMIESIQTQLIDKTEKIANLTKERVGNTIMVVDSSQTNINPPSPPPSGGSKGDSISIIETNPLSKLHHILHRFT